MSMNYLQAPPINQRTRIPEEVVRELVHQIAVGFNPWRIILFGSHATGNPGPESDIDLLVIMDTPLRRSEQAQRIRQVINPMFGTDILVYTPEQVQQRLEWGDWFLKSILEEGVIVYESTDA
jgi:predicted nucleotidyltransferase